jgi:hypothetical protein
LVAVVGGAGIWCLVTIFTGPPLLRQNDQEVDARQNPYMKSTMDDFDRRMNDLREQQSRALEEAIEIGNRATSS